MITDSDLKKLKSALAPEFKKLDDKITDVNSKVDGLSTTVGNLSTKVNDLTTKVDEVKVRLDVLENNLTGEIAKLQDENFITSTYRSSIEDHEQRIIDLESK